MRLPLFKILVADVRAGLRQLYEEKGPCIDVCVSSPPYYAQRDYGVDGQIGHEATSQEFVDTMVDIFANYVAPLLKPHGSMFINLGDSYNGSNGQGDQTIRKATANDGKHSGRETTGVRAKNDESYKPRDLMNVPMRVFEGLRQSGLYWRSTTIWAKTNGMPESVAGVRWLRHRVRVEGQNSEAWKENLLKTSGASSMSRRQKYAGDTKWADCPGCKKCEENDGYILAWGSGRPVNKYEFIGILTKAEYYWDNEAVRTPYAESSVIRRQSPLGSFGPENQGGARMSKTTDGATVEDKYAGANMVNVWEEADEYLIRWLAREYPELLDEYTMYRTEMGDIWKLPTASFSGKHFATFPTKLPELAIKAATSEHGCCGECGKPYARILEQTGRVMEGVNSRTADINGLSESSALRGNGVQVFRTVGWKATCKHTNAEVVPAVVLDPFNGAGTTGLVATRLGRDYYGVELSDTYAGMATERIYEDAPMLHLLAMSEEMERLRKIDAEMELEAEEASERE